jgi:hypothetical protein
MRENRPYGSEGGEGQTLPDPYQQWDSAMTAMGFIGGVTL